MTPAKLSQRRLHNQALVATKFANPADVVRWLGAVQAQEYLGALWAIGLRTSGATESSVEQAIADRHVVRTWPMRSTLHFVAAEDVHWMLDLLTPRVVAGAAGWLQRRFGVDPKVVSRSADVVARALEGGRRLSRGAIYQALNAARIPTAGGRGPHLVWSLAHRGIICYGPREGKQQTFVLLDEWIPRAKLLPREEALARLAQRYFTSHGPATAHDFAWWSGLRLRDVAEGIALVRERLASFELAGRTYWTSPSSPNAARATRAALLLPPFDEFTVAYRDRSAVLSAADARRVRGLDLLRPTIVINGRVVGHWSTRRSNGAHKIRLEPFALLSESARRAAAAAQRRYATFQRPAADAS